MDSATPHIEAALSFIADAGSYAAHYIYPLSSGRQNKRPQQEFKTVPIYDARQLSTPPCLDEKGFQLITAATNTRDFYNEEAVRRDYYPEVIRLLKQALGAKEVIVFDHNQRSVKRAKAGQPGVRLPAESAHVDYTPTSGPRRAREVLYEADMSIYACHRMALINVWRPIIGPVQDFPIAVCDPCSSTENDYVQTDIHHFNEDDLENPQLSGQIYSLRYNPSQRWYYCPEMSTQESLLLRNWDSAVTDHSCFAAHTGFKNPFCPSDVTPRESIEVRTLVIFP